MCESDSPSVLTQEYEKAMAEVDRLGLDVAFAHFRVRYKLVMSKVPHVSHQVLRYHRSGMEWEPGPRGGGTRVRLYDKSHIVVGEHYEKCSLQDAFCYQKGRTMTLGRAVKMYKEELSDRMTPA